jgi:hypothetical protein
MQALIDRILKYNYTIVNLSVFCSAVHVVRQSFQILNVFARMAVITVVTGQLFQLFLEIFMDLLLHETRFTSNVWRVAWDKLPTKLIINILSICRTNSSTLTFPEPQASNIK